MTGGNGQSRSGGRAGERPRVLTLAERVRQEEVTVTALAGRVVQMEAHVKHLAQAVAESAVRIEQLLRHLEGGQR